MHVQPLRHKFMKKASAVTYMSIVAESAPKQILLGARTAGKQKYQNKIAPRKTLIVVSNILVGICSIIVVPDVKEKTRSNSFDHSGKNEK